MIRAITAVLVLGIGLAVRPAISETAAATDAGGVTVPAACSNVSRDLERRAKFSRLDGEGAADPKDSIDVWGLALYKQLLLLGEPGIRGACSALGTTYDEVPCRGKAKARELILYARRHNALQTLESALARGIQPVDAVSRSLPERLLPHAPFCGRAAGQALRELEWDEQRAVLVALPLCDERERENLRQMYVERETSFSSSRACDIYQACERHGIVPHLSELLTRLSEGIPALPEVQPLPPAPTSLWDRKLTLGPGPLSVEQLLIVMSTLTATEMDDLCFAVQIRPEQVSLTSPLKAEHVYRYLYERRLGAAAAGALEAGLRAYSESR